jgi:2-polyprenyl-3-methyl-5-hydroxy-6-metoxy-1,4-benzoquinol methylase
MDGTTTSEVATVDRTVKVCEPSKGATMGLRPCPLCGARDFRSVFEPIKKCSNCGLCLVNPLGEFRGENETQEYFLNDYLPVHLANLDNSLAERRAHIATITRYFNLPNHPRHLDVGCALGSMLQEAKLLGWDSLGVETSAFAAQYAAQHTGCPVHAGTLQDAGFPAESFDVVTLMDVIEHIPEPAALMQEVHRILRPGGVVFIVTPNFASFFVWLYGPTAYGVWPDQHVVYFQPATIKKLLQKVGFARTVAGSKDFYGENIRRFLHQKGPQADVAIKSAFRPQSRLAKIRHLVNAILMRVTVGDKLIALAQK